MNATATPPWMPVMNTTEASIVQFLTDLSSLCLFVWFLVFGGLSTATVLFLSQRLQRSRWYFVSTCLIVFFLFFPMWWLRRWKLDFIISQTLMTFYWICLAFIVFDKHDRRDALAHGQFEYAPVVVPNNPAA